MARGKKPRKKDGDLDSWTDRSSFLLHFNAFKQYVHNMSTVGDAVFSVLKLLELNSARWQSRTSWKL